MSKRVICVLGCIVMILGILTLSGCAPASDRYDVISCSRCRGRGEVFDAGWVRCPRCRGSGRDLRLRDSARERDDARREQNNAIFYIVLVAGGIGLVAWFVIKLINEKKEPKIAAEAQKRKKAQERSKSKGANEDEMNDWISNKFPSLSKKHNIPEKTYIVYLDKRRIGVRGHHIWVYDNILSIFPVNIATFDDYCAITAYT